MAFTKALLVGMGVTIGLLIGQVTQPNLFAQSSFPCQEDEVLMFVDNAISKDATGCVSLDYLLSYKENN